MVKNSKLKVNTNKFKSTIFVTNPIGSGKFELLTELGKTERQSYQKVMKAFESCEHWKYPNTSWITPKDIVCIETTEI